MIFKTVIITIIHLFIFHRMGKIMKKWFKIKLHRVNIIFGFVLFTAINGIIGAYAYIANWNIIMYNQVLWPIIGLLMIFSYIYVPLQITNKAKIGSFIKDHSLSIVIAVVLMIFLAIQPVTAFEASNTDDNYYVNLVKHLNLNQPINLIFPRNGLEKADISFSYKAMQFNYLTNNFFINLFNIDPVAYVRFNTAVLNYFLIIATLEGFIFNFYPKKRIQIYGFMVLSFIFPFYFADLWSQYYRFFYTPWFYSILACLLIPIYAFFIISPKIKHRWVLWIISLIAANNISLPAAFNLGLVFFAVILQNILQDKINQKNLIRAFAIIMISNLVINLPQQIAFLNREAYLIDYGSGIRENIIAISSLYIPISIALFIFFLKKYPKINFEHKAIAIIPFLIMAIYLVHIGGYLVIKDTVFAFRRILDSTTIPLLIIAVAELEFSKTSGKIIIGLFVMNTIPQNFYANIDSYQVNYSKENPAVTQIVKALEEDAKGEKKFVYSQYSYYFENRKTARGGNQALLREVLNVQLPSNFKMQIYLKDVKSEYANHKITNLSIDGADVCSSLTRTQITNDAKYNDYIILHEGYDNLIKCYLETGYENIKIVEEPIDFKKIYVLKNIRKERNAN